MDHHAHRPLQDLCESLTQLYGQKLQAGQTTKRRRRSGKGKFYEEVTKPPPAPTHTSDPTSSNFIVLIFIFVQYRPDDDLIAELKSGALFKGAGSCLDGTHVARNSPACGSAAARVGVGVVVAMQV